MKKAEQVKKQIKDYYKDSYINYVDLIKNLYNDKIDNFEYTLKNSGYDKPYNDYYPTIIYYDDDSILVVTGFNIISANQHEG